MVSDGAKILSLDLITDPVLIHPLPKYFRRLDHQCSGSGQFSMKQLPNLNLPNDATVVDLRQEFHFFLQDDALTLFSPYFRRNIGLSTSTVLVKEKEWVKKLNNRTVITFRRVLRKNKKKIPIAAREVSVRQPYRLFTEEEFLRRHKVRYKRFAATDHRFPDPQVVDDFLAWFRALPQTACLHFHCRGGKGRTTIFMTFVDMMRHRNQFTFDQYIERQVAIGGSDLRVVNINSPYLKEHLQQRIVLLQKFYDYMMSESGLKWSAWLNLQP